MKTVLVILAAGVGSRFGGGVKQLSPVGPCGEIMMDYAIHDAWAAGFSRVVFVIRRELEAEFRAGVGARAARLCPVDYAFQEKEDLPAGFVCPATRHKPWGTGQALLSCRGIVREPFLVINADDYYGRESFVLAQEFLTKKAGREGAYCMPGFLLGNTLSENGAVSRGICTVREGYLAGIVETGGILRDGAGGAVVENGGVRTPIDPESIVSMNMWALTPDFFHELQAGFCTFLATVGASQAEYFLPAAIDAAVRAGRASVRVYPTREQWFGVTYSADRQRVVDALAALHERGVYNKRGLYAR